MRNFFQLNMLLLIAWSFITISTISSCTPTKGEESNLQIKINHAESVAALLPRKNEMEGKEEYEMLKNKYEESVKVLQEKGYNPKAYLNLAAIYITECRITGNADYYNKAAIQVLDKIIQNDKADVNSSLEAYSLKSAVYLNIHQFEKGKQMALKGLSINPGNAGLYGALVDASVELGDYKSAVMYCDKMLSIRPDLRSYSRASYIRQIYGDNKGAMDAMKMAVEAGVAGNENTEWARVHLGDLYMNEGKLKEATDQYNISLAARPNYPHAEIGLAKVDKLNKNYVSAIDHTKKAIAQLSEASFVSFLGELYELNGDQAKADKIYGDVLELMGDSNDANAKDSLKHNGNREFAMAYLDLKDYDNALKFAKADLDSRPENIDANDLIAWILYKKGDAKAALPYSNKVFSTKIKNADMLYKASLINSAAGNKEKSESLMKESMAVSDKIDPRFLTSK